MTKTLKDTPKNTPEEKKKNSLYHSVYSYTCNNTKLDRESIENFIKSIPQNNQPCRLLGGGTQTQSEELKKSFEHSLQYIDSQIKEFEDLEKALPEGIVKQNKESWRYKPILIIGGKEGLVNGVVSHLWYTHPIVPKGNSIYIDLINKDLLKGYIGRIRFKEVNYTGKTKEYIEKDIDSILKHYLTGGMLFLRGIRSDSSGIFEYLASRTSNPGSGEIKGVLIISTDNLPQDLKSQFEVIELEPEKQDIPASTPQDTAKQAKFIPFLTPSGTQWHEVEISFVDNENVSIKIRDVSQRKNYAEMGFKDQRTHKPVKSWETLLLFSKEECLKYTQNIKSKTEKRVEDLRKRLKAYFNIQSNPIVLEHGYKPVFKVCMIDQSRSVHTFSNSDTFNDDKEDD